MDGQLKAEFEKCLWEHVLDPWFPRCLDEVHGGFLSDFDRSWKPAGPQDKQSEFQARQTVLAATASKAYPDAQHLRKATLHGFDFLCHGMWDEEYGGWFYRTDRAGKPLMHETKHVHSFAYGISACAATYEATGDPAALDRAKQAFLWLEEFSYDPEQGGYFGYLRRDGSQILNQDDNPVSSPVDGIGVPPGYKDTNVLTDMMEALLNLLRVWPDAHVRRRLNELVDLLVDKLMSASGSIPYVFQPDWTPVAHVERFGIGLQVVPRLLEIDALIRTRDDLGSAARRMVDHVLRNGWDPMRGGLFYAAPAARPFHILGHQMVVTKKVWWVQVEALRTFCVLSADDGQEGTYHDYFLAQWAYMKRWLIDERRGGFYREGLDQLSRWNRAEFRLSPRHPIGVKGEPYKDGSHEGRALLNCLQLFNSPRDDQAGSL